MQLFFRFFFSSKNFSPHLLASHHKNIFFWPISASPPNVCTELFSSRVQPQQPFLESPRLKALPFCDTSQKFNSHDLHPITPTTPFTTRKLFKIMIDNISLQRHQPLRANRDESAGCAGPSATPQPGPLACSAQKRGPAGH